MVYVEVESPSHTLRFCVLSDGAVVCNVFLSKRKSFWGRLRVAAGYLLGRQRPYGDWGTTELSRTDRNELIRLMEYSVLTD